MTVDIHDPVALTPFGLFPLQVRLTYPRLPDQERGQGQGAGLAGQGARAGQGPWGTGWEEHGPHRADRARPHGRFHAGIALAL